MQSAIDADVDEAGLVPQRDIFSLAFVLSGKRCCY